MNEQLVDFQRYWPHVYSEAANNFLKTMKIGYYFVPALLFDSTFRRALLAVVQCCSSAGVRQD